MKGSASEFSDWADLPLLVLQLISEKINFITDYVRYRAVCSSWRFASLPKPHHLPPQLPWLILPEHKIQQGSQEDDGIRFFLDYWQSKTHQIHVPETIDKICRASCHGWLLFVAYGGKEIFLLNPLTRARIQLPPYTTPSKIRRSHQHVCSVCNVLKLSFCGNPSDPNCLIIVFDPYCPNIVFCHVRDLCWTQVDLSPLVSAELELLDVAYSNGRFYLLRDKSILIYDLNQHKLLGSYFFKPDQFLAYNKFFLEGTSGLYVVATHYTDERGVKVEDFTENNIKQRIALYQVQEQQIDGTKRIADKWDSFDGGCMYLKYMQHVQYFYVACARVVRTDNPGPGNETYLFSILSAKLNDGKSELIGVGLGEKLPIWMPFWMAAKPALWFQPSFV